MLTYFQAIVIGVLQGASELFPISSLGHSVLVPALVGGGWSNLVTQSSTQTSESSPYLAFIVALHVATAIALLIYFRSDWGRIVRGLFSSLHGRRAETSSERLAWLLIIGTIPVGITGILLEHTFRVLFAKPLAAAIFLTINGLILFAGEGLRRRSVRRHAAHQSEGNLVVGENRTINQLSYPEAGVIGTFQTLALLAGISRSGITMVGGLLRGLDHEDAARFSFLLATPVILAAGLLKLPSLAGHAGDHIRGQVVVGAIAAGITAYFSVRFLIRFFQTRTLTPFAIYCVAMGTACIVVFA